MILYKQAPMGDIDEKSGIVKGYGSIFGNKDSDGDIIEKGAYKKTLEETGKRVKYIYQHDITKPLGVMKELYEDDKGLAFTAKVPDTRLGKDVLELMRAGVITENSVGILPVVKEYDDDKEARYIKEVKLYEVSAVTLAANDEAKIQEVKGKKDNADVWKESISNINKLLKQADISDELGFNIEYVIQCLKKNIDFTKPTDEVTLPSKKYLKSGDVYKFLFNRLK
jgi:HK97 family phage prohead protease